MPSFPHNHLFSMPAATSSQLSPLGNQSSPFPSLLLLPSPLKWMACKYLSFFSHFIKQFVFIRLEQKDVKIVFESTQIATT
jgi:hypothetical protein